MINKATILLLTLLFCSSIGQPVFAQIMQGELVYELSSREKTAEEKKQQEDDIREKVGGDGEMFEMALNIVNSLNKMPSYERLCFKDNHTKQGSDWKKEQTGMGTYKSTIHYRFLDENEVVSSVPSIALNAPPTNKKDTLVKIDWQITEESDSIGGFDCQKATAVVDGKNITAWFTLEIPVAAGPSIYWGLPGLILDLQIENGTHYTFSSFSPALDESELVLPAEVEALRE